MSGETKQQESGWTTDTLKQHYDKLREADQIAIQAALLAAKEAVAAALAAAKEAVNEAKVTQDQQLKAHNGLIRKMETQTNTFIPRHEYDVQHKALEEKVSVLTDRMNQDKGGEINMGKIYAAVGVVGAILGIIILLANNVF